jgi:xanthine dehydrogenase YagT iron-sulfur-binding subunit
MSFQSCTDVEENRDDTLSEQSTSLTDLELSRRTFVKTAGILSAAVATGIPQLATAEDMQAAAATTPQMLSVTLKVNGKSQSLSLDTRTSLLDALREHLALTGSKKGCDHGQCGACTVLVDGRRVNSCLTLAVMTAGKDVTTIEGIGQPGNLHPMQAAFVEHDGYQCGYCTSGQIMSAVALLKEPVGASEEEVKQAMSGNICRCGAYPNILTAVQQVRAQQGHGQQLRS